MNDVATTEKPDGQKIVDATIGFVIESAIMLMTSEIEAKDCAHPFKMLQIIYSTKYPEALVEFKTAYDSCESPIEKQFFLWLHANLCGAHILSYIDRIRVVLPKDEAPKPDGNEVFIFPQATIENMRIDFLVELHSGKKISRIAIECDGHDYHERTKSQAAKDRSRDRKLQKLGLKVFRFTGSEIHHGPQKCAREVCDLFRAEMDEQLEESKACT